MPPDPLNSDNREQRRWLFWQDVYLSVGFLALVAAVFIWMMRGSIGSKQPTISSVQKGMEKP